MCLNGKSLLFSKILINMLIKKIKLVIGTFRKLLKIIVHRQIFLGSLQNKARKRSLSLVSVCILDLYV